MSFANYKKRGVIFSIRMQSVMNENYRNLFGGKIEDKYCFSTAIWSWPTSFLYHVTSQPECTDEDCQDSNFIREALSLSGG
jgi:hypothetical protein